MFNHATPMSKFAIILMLILLLGTFTACGSNASSSGSGSTDSGAAASSDNNAPAIPTMPIPKENFKAHAENQITQTTSVSNTQSASQTQATTTTTTSASADDLARGSRSYAKNKCGDCHGDKGAVVAGKTTKAIGGTALAADQFDQFLRTGGGLGDTHIFGPGAISPGGMQALYAYVKSLPGK